ncbi:hypothetical protein MtrunA17_Chr7g0234101 [Medicago truncatula]|uniref:Uncharacterized protein n=1 Tax=Medicago truncatula TaxID=3880 RepID=A0A396GYZ1_MEDTR|nr:hypothetical protein MtrunA17_Chr7g0234101 [Medicago truncatula]
MNYYFPFNKSTCFIHVENENPYSNSKNYYSSKQLNLQNATSTPTKTTNSKN